MRLFFVVFVVILSVFTAGCNSNANHEDGEMSTSVKKNKDALNYEYRLLPMDQIHRKKLQEIQYWSMKKGVAEFYKTRDVSHIAEYVKSRGYGLVLKPQVDKHHTCQVEGRYKGQDIHTLVRFVIQQQYMMNELWCLEQVEHNDFIYEYWVMQERSQGRSYEHYYRNCTFIITKADGLTGERKILHSSEQFFSTYKIDSGFSINFPEDKIISLHVGRFPEHFQETEMKEIKEILQRLK